MSGQTPAREPSDLDRAMMVPEAAARSSDAPPLPPGFDPRVWIFNPSTRQFHRFMGKRAGYYLLNADAYEDRLKKYLKEEGGLRVTKILALISWAIFLWFYYLMSTTTRPGEAVTYQIFLVWPVGLVTMLFSAAALWTKTITLPAKLREVGPPPPQAPGREQVERQKVHGAGGVLSGDRLREAARGSATAAGQAAPLETFDD